MTNKFVKALEGLLDRPVSRPKPAVRSEPKGGEHAPMDIASRRREWFATLASTRVMPLLDPVVKAVEKHHATASSRLVDQDGRLSAQLTLAWGQLPRGSKPPR